MNDYLNDKKLIKKFETFLASDETELYSPEGISAAMRKVWHMLTEKYKLYSISAGEGMCRHVIVSKNPFKINGDKPFLLSSTAQRRFRDDFGIKINVCDYEDFEYYVDLYNFRPQLNLTLAAIAEFVQKGENELAWMNYLIEVKKKIWSHIKSTEGYHKFMTADLTEFLDAINKVKDKLNFQDAYLLKENSGKLYVSIDLKSANYNSLYWFAKEMFIVNDKQVTSWDEFVSSFSENPGTTEYLKMAKLFRQKIFWEFDHDRQEILQEYLITRAMTNITFPIIQAYHIRDEIVFEINNESEALFWEFAKTLDPNLYRANTFKLYQVAKNKEWLIRKFSNGVIDIKCCKPTEYAVIWKHMHDLAIEQKDLKWRWNRETHDWDYLNGDIEWLIVN